MGNGKRRQREGSNMSQPKLHGRLDGGSTGPGLGVGGSPVGVRKEIESSIVFEY